MANDSIALLLPWPVFIAKAPNQTTISPTATCERNVFLAVIAADDDSTLRAVDAHIRQSADVFEGFVVGVNQLQEVNMSPTSARAAASVQVRENTPLLGALVSSPSLRDRERPNVPLATLRKRCSFLEKAENSFVLSIPFERSPVISIDISTSHDERGVPSVIEPIAYLIELPQVKTTEGGPSAVQETSQEFVLAVPDSSTLYTHMTQLDCCCMSSARFLSLVTCCYLHHCL